jgi:hypothetical protein
MGVCCLSKPDGTEKTYLDEDPVFYDDGPAERRASSHVTFGGSRVRQDFGAKDVDRQIRLRTDWMTEATLGKFKAKFDEVGKVWLWSDHKEHQYKVFFRSLGQERIRGHAAYRVEMVFDVVEVLA